MLLGLVGLLVVFLLVGSGAYILESGLFKKEEPEDEEPDVGYGDEVTLYGDTYQIKNRFDTLLFMGTDNSGNEEAEGDDYLGSLADFLLLMVIDHTDDTYAFLTIDRNTMVDVPLLDRDGIYSETYKEQICTAHWYGSNKEMSCDNTVDALSRYLGDLTIDGYYSISMSEIPRINHELGGVTVTLEDDFTESDPAMKKGVTLTLTDEQAEIYLRARTSMEDESNKKRMERQQVYMKEAMKKVKERMTEDPDYYKKVSENLKETSVSTITGKQKSRAANALVKYEYLGHFDIEGEVKMGDTFHDGVEYEEFYPSSDSVLDVMTRLYKLEKDDAEAQEDIDEAEEE